jgi:hypothetical protein
MYFILFQLKVMKQKTLAMKIPGKIGKGKINDNQLKFLVSTGQGERGCKTILILCYMNLHTKTITE